MPNKASDLFEEYLNSPEAKKILNTSEGQGNVIKGNSVTIPNDIVAGMIDKVNGTIYLGHDQE